MKTFFFAVLASLVLTSAHAQITSTFDSDADGWAFTNVSTSVPVNHQAAGGNPTGFISATYSSNASATVQNWIAPAKFHGNQLIRSLGMQLKFDLQQSQAGTGAGYDVLIRNGSNFIYLSGITPKPAVAPVWTSYSFTLDETGGWYYSSGSVIASRAQIKGILANVTSIEIRGTYASNATYTSGLDNVVLEQRILTPPPNATSLSASSGKPGDIITINGSGFNTTASNNVISFGEFAGIKAVVQSATATRLDVVVPLGAVSGRITITNTITGLTSKASIPFIPVFEGGGRIIPASFAPKFSIATIQNEGWFVGDIDGDGWEDFGVANNNTDNAVDIYRNLGLGGTLSTASFAAKVSTSIPPLAGGGANGAGLWFADLDGDGKLDAISSNKMFIFGAAGFVTLRNISTPGNIAFEAPEYWVGNSDETPIALVADIDGDGRPEMISGEGSACSCGTARSMWIIQNISTPGDIEFGASQNISFLVDGFAGVSASDLDNDGKPELLVSWFFGDRFSIIKNNSTPGNISLTDLGTISTGQYNASLQGADFNLDGKNDLVWKKTSGEIYIRLNTNIGAPLALTDFATEFILTSDLGAQGGISIADVNGDGKLDIVATDNTDVGVYENIYAGGVFDASAFVPAYQVLGGGAYSPRISDLNHDTKPDFVLASGGSVTIVENKNIHAPVISLNTVSPLKGDVGSTVNITGNNFSTVPSENKVWFGHVEATVLTSTANLITVAVPAAASNAPVSVTKNGLTSRYRVPFQTTFGPGVTFDNTHFAPPVSYTLTGAIYDIETGDLNRDGTLDIIALGTASNTYAFRNVYTSGAINSSSLIPDDTLSGSLNPRLEDFDGDGYFDVMAVNGPLRKNNSTLTEISFLPQVIIPLGASIVDFADFNNDGKTDMTLTTDLSGAGDLLVLENRSTNTPGNFATGTYGAFSQNFLYNKPSANGATITGDFDGDGFTDIVTTNPTTDNISIYRNLGVLKISSAQFATRVDVSVGDNPGRIYKGDFDSDGRLDLLLYHGTGTSTTLLIVLQNTSTVGNISFSRIDLTNPFTVTVAHIADLDGDGKPEIITTSETGNRFSIFKNIHTSGALTAASFAAPFNTTVTAPRGLTTGDLNLDSKPEIIITRAAGLLVVYENLIPSALPPVITSFTPTFGGVGTTVTITGTNFSVTPADNIVMFNGISAVVTASSATSITCTVPAGATAGKISITVAGNTVSSVSDFTVHTATLSITTQPSNISTCVGEIVTFTTAATGTTNITYQWQLREPDFTFTDIVNGGAYSGATTPTLTVNSGIGIVSLAYRCRINGDLAAQEISNTANLLILLAPFAPTTTGASICPSAQATLTASGGINGQYKWYTVPIGGTAIAGEVNNTYITPSLTATTTYYVSVALACESPRSQVTASILTSGCNAAPIINSVQLTTAVEGKIVLDLVPLIFVSGTLDINSIQVKAQPSSGALATIVNGVLTIDYAGKQFSGDESITIQACDISGPCSEQLFNIEVAGDITVYNAISPNNDDKNEIFYIKYIDVIPQKQSNVVSIYNRWGSKVFEVENYNNTDRVFKGLTQSGNELPSGTYFYRIFFTSPNLPKEEKEKSGYLVLKR